MSSTPLGMPALPPRTAHPAWKQAWDSALYGPGGFLRNHPISLGGRDRGELLEFITARVADHPEVVLYGAAGSLAPDLASRFPDTLFRPDLPSGFDGLLVSVDWLGHVPTHVVQADDDGRPRVVHVDPVTGKEQLGLVLDDPGVPPSILDWQQQFWPLPEPYLRAEIGTTREAAWRDLVGRLDGGSAVCIETGHTLDTRPRDGSLRNPDGQALVPDRSRDLVADVALDALAGIAGSSFKTEGSLTTVEFSAPG